MSDSHVVLASVGLQRLHGEGQVMCAYLREGDQPHC